MMLRWFLVLASILMTSYSSCYCSIDNDAVLTMMLHWLGMVFILMKSCNSCYCCTDNDLALLGVGVYSNDVL